MTVAEILAKTGKPFFYDLVTLLQPKYVVELGTGAGYTAAIIATALPEDSYFATINWPNPPSGDDVGRELRPYLNDRIHQILGDTRDCSHHFLDNSIDLLYIDSGTTYGAVLGSVAV